MTTRRSILALITGGLAVALAPIARAAAPEAPGPKRMPAFGTPRGVVVESYECSAAAHATAAMNRCLGKPVGLVFPRQTLMLISTGREFVPLEGEEGQAIARATAIHLMSDGAFRQHQWPR